MPGNNTSVVGSYSSGVGDSTYNDIFLDPKQEEALEDTGIDVFDFENIMDNDERLEAIEDAGLNSWEFDIF